MQYVYGDSEHFVKLVTPYDHFLWNRETDTCMCLEARGQRRTSMTSSAMMWMETM